MLGSVTELVVVKCARSEARLCCSETCYELGTSWLGRNINPFKAHGLPEPLRVRLAAAIARGRDVSWEEVLDCK